MPITTFDKLQKNAGQMCSLCKRRMPLARWLDGTGFICSECDTRPNLITLADDDEPVTRGEGAVQ